MTMTMISTTIVERNPSKFWWRELYRVGSENSIPGSTCAGRREASARVASI